MAEQGFPLPTSSYKELIKIVQAYGKAGTEVVPSDVARVIGINETIISANNKFLVAVGIVQGGRKKTITSIGIDLARALEHDRQDEVSRHWRTIVDATEFLQKIVAAVRIRKGMDESSLEAHVAYSAGQPKTPRIIAGAGAVVEMLKVAGMLKEEGGNLVAITPEVLRASESSEEPLYSAQIPLPSTSLVAPLHAEGRPTGNVQLNIEVRIQCTPKDLDDLGQKLRKVLEDFNRQEAKKDVSAPDLETGERSV